MKRFPLFLFTRPYRNRIRRTFVHGEFIRASGIINGGNLDQLALFETERLVNFYYDAPCNVMFTADEIAKGMVCYRQAVGGKPATLTVAKNPYARSVLFLARHALATQASMVIDGFHDTDEHINYCGGVWPRRGYIIGSLKDLPFKID